VKYKKKSIIAANMPQSSGRNRQTLVQLNSQDPAKPGVTAVLIGPRFLRFNLIDLVQGGG
jgi:hypothetical protein